MSEMICHSVGQRRRRRCSITPATAKDGLIWVYSPGDDGVMAFTDFGIETLTGLIEIYKANPDLLKRSSDPK
jgi:hypothetical protein